MSIRIPRAQTPLPAAAIRAAHHALVRRAPLGDPASNLLASQMNDLPKNFFGEGKEGGARFCI